MRVIVNDIPGTAHADGVRAAILAGYNCSEDKSKYPDVDISQDVVVMNGSFDDIVNYAKTDEKVVAIARSTSGIRNFVNSAQTIYPGVQSFIPMGSNAYVELKIFTDPAPPVIVTCGCGDDEDRNNTAWGNGLEFWDTDWLWVGGSDASSFANGWVCGKILRIYDELLKVYGEEEATWWWARSLARETAYRIESNRPKDEEGNPVKWHIMNGYGRIALDRALDNITIFKPEEDPYLIDFKVGPVGTTKCTPYGAVKVVIEPVDNAVLYEISRNNIVIKQIKAGDLLEYTDILQAYGTYYYSYHAIGIYDRTAESNKIKAIYAIGDHPKIIRLVGTEPIINND